MSKGFDDDHAALLVDRMIASIIRSAQQRQGGSYAGAELPAMSRDEFMRDFRNDPVEVIEVKIETMNRLFDVVFSDGPNPVWVLHNLICIVHALQPERLCNMSSAEVAACLDRTKASHTRRIRIIFDRFFKRLGRRPMKLRMQKSDEARATYSQVQRGNTNRAKKPSIRKVA